jgi:hypothetical protein
MNSINERWAVPSSVPRPRMRGGAPFNKRNSVGIPTASASPAWKRTVSTTSAQREQLTSLQELSERGGRRESDLLVSPAVILLFPSFVAIEPR